MLAVEPLKQHKGTFAVKDFDTWVLPVLARSSVDYSTAASADIIYLTLGSDTEGTFTGKFTDVHGDWVLANDGATLTLNYGYAEQNIQTTLDVISFEGPKNSAVVKHQVSGEGPLELDTISYIRRVAPYTPQPSEVLTHNEDEFFARFLSAPSSVWKNNLPPVESLGANWYLRSDGVIFGVQRWCEGNLIYFTAHCAEEDTKFSLSEDDSYVYVWRFVDGQRLEFSLPSYPDYVVTTYTALDNDETYNVTNVVEYWPDSNSTSQAMPLRLWPRIKPWVRISHIDFLTGNDENKNSASSYQIMHSTQLSQEPRSKLQ